MAWKKCITGAHFQMKYWVHLVLSVTLAKKDINDSWYQKLLNFRPVMDFSNISDVASVAICGISQLLNKCGYLHFCKNLCFYTDSHAFCKR